MEEVARAAAMLEPPLLTPRNHRQAGLPQQVAREHLQQAVLERLQQPVAAEADAVVVAAEAGAALGRRRQMPRRPRRLR